MQQAFKGNVQIHHGDNVKHIRKMKGEKQYTLADECGWSQQTMSRLEHCERIDDARLEHIAAKLEVTSEFIKNFNNEKVIYNIQHDITVHGNASNLNGYQPTYNNNNPIEPLIELFEKFLKEDQKKIQSLEVIGQTVRDLAEEIKKMKAARK